MMASSRIIPVSTLTKVVFSRNVPTTIATTTTTKTKTTIPMMRAMTRNVTTRMFHAARPAILSQSHPSHATTGCGTAASSAHCSNSAYFNHGNLQTRRQQKPATSLARNCCVRSYSIAGSGVGKGGGAGGSIKSAGGAHGKKAHVQEEEYFRKEQERKFEELKKAVVGIREAKTEFHEKQRDRHLEKVKRHKELFAKDKDPTHKIFIENHQEAADDHQEHIKKMNNNWQ